MGLESWRVGERVCARGVGVWGGLGRVGASDNM
jgi:hypothetical protein